MRAARREDLLSLALTDRRSGYPLEMVVRASDAGLRVRETDVPYVPRAGKSKVTGTWRGTWHAVRDMRAVLARPPGVGPGRPGPTGTRRPSGGSPPDPESGPRPLGDIAQDPGPNAPPPDGTTQDLRPKLRPTDGTGMAS